MNSFVTKAKVASFSLSLSSHQITITTIHSHSEMNGFGYWVSTQNSNSKTHKIWILYRVLDLNFGFLVVNVWSLSQNRYYNSYFTFICIRFISYIIYKNVVTVVLMIFRMIVKLNYDASYFKFFDKIYTYAEFLRNSHTKECPL